MRWKKGVAILLALLVLLFVMRSIWHIVRTTDRTLPATVDPTLPFYAVYFAGPDASGLYPEFHQGEATIEEYITILLQGPSLPNLFAVMPKDVQFLDYNLHEDILFLNFSHHIVTNHPGGSAGEILTVYAIVNTFVGVQGIKRVQILVEGRMIPTLAGHLDLTEPLEKDYTLLDSFYF